MDGFHVDDDILQPHNGRAWAGLLAGALVWLFSIAALSVAMRENWLASELARTHQPGAVPAVLAHLRLAATFWALGFTVLQVVSLLVFALAMRAFWRLRTAVCYTLGAGLVIAGDAFGLAGLLVWVGFTFGAA